MQINVVPGRSTTTGIGSTRSSESFKGPVPREESPDQTEDEHGNPRERDPFHFSNADSIDDPKLSPYTSTSEIKMREDEKRNVPNRWEMTGDFTNNYVRTNEKDLRIKKESMTNKIETVREKVQETDYRELNVRKEDDPRKENEDTRETRIYERERREKKLARV